MKKLLLVCALALSLGGCVNGQLINPFASIANPVSKDSLAKIEAGYGAAESIALAYGQACQSGAIPASCWTIVKSIKSASAYAHQQLLVARNFVKNNPTVDATVILTTAQAAVDAFTTAANAAKAGS